MAKWRLFSTLSLLALTIGSQAQSPYRFRNLTSHDGLSSNLVISMEQDSLGFMWFQDFQAVTRYDGYEFKTYRYNPLDAEGSVPEGLLGRLYRDKAGHIWIGPGIGRYYKREPIQTLAMFDFKSEKFIKHRIDLKGPSVRCMDFDADNRSLWIGTNQNGIYRYDLYSGAFENFLNPDTSARGASNSIARIFDVGESLIFHTGTGIKKFIKKSKRFKSADHSGEGIWEFSFLKSGRYANHFVAQRYHEIIVYDLDLTVVKRFRHNEPYLFNAEGDDDGNLWIMGINNGIYRWNPDNNEFERIHRIAGDPQSLSSDVVECMIMDRDQHIWVGTEDKGACMLLKPALRARNFSFPSLNAVTTLRLKGKPYAVIFESESIPYYDNPNNRVMIAEGSSLDSIRFTDSGLRIFGLGNAFTFREKSWWIASDGIHEVKVDTSGGRLAPADIRSFTRIKQNPYSLPIARTTGIYQDAKGNVWVGSKNQGLYKFVPSILYGKEGSVIFFRHSVTDSTTISNNLVTSVFAEDDNSFWVSTQAGLDLYKDGTFTHVLKNKGIVNAILKTTDGTIYAGTSNGMYKSLPSDRERSFTYDTLLGNFEVHGINTDRLGRFWITNSEGLFCYDRKKASLIKFDATDGVDHYNGFDHFRSNVSMATDYALSNGLLISRSHEGITIIDPTSLRISAATVTPVLTSIEVNNQTPPINDASADFSLASHASVLDKLVLDYLHNNFTIRFAALELVSPQRNRYRYQLKGYDPEWINTDWLNRKATYTNLESGEYKFILQASNHHGVWSEASRQLTVIVLPPPWKTWWAFSAYAFISGAALFFARRNVIQREKLKTRLKLEHMELEQSKKIDKVKSTFFTNISHEFRTPLTLIKGPAANLADEFPENARVKHSVNIIQHNADVLLTLINQLLDLSKLESGSMMLHPTDFQLNLFLRDMASSFQALALQKNLAFEFHPPLKSYRVIADKEKLDTILRNLLGNAIKFTASGKVMLQAEVHLHGFEQELIIKITDTGLGIPFDEQAKVFERFYQVNDANPHRDIGTGIGLSLVKELVMLMNGTINLSSEPKKGTCFEIRVPVKVHELMMLSQEEILHPLAGHSQTLTDTHQQETIPESPVEKVQVLVVEDNDELRSFIVSAFDGAYTLREASNGREGFEIAREEVPEIILSDVMMPEMDGFAMLQRLKKDPVTNHIPVIMLTAKIEEENKLEGLSRGADDYLTKPFDKKELILKVRNKIAQQQGIRDSLRMSLLQQATPVQAMSSDEQFVVSVRSAIEARISDDQLSVESLADQLSMSRVQLYRKINALTGMTVNELIRSLRLNKAEQLLRQRWGSVSQVAYETGFNNLSYFSKCFKEAFGALPSEYSPVEEK